jgi:cell division FtsZ-interacting protein ZapD
MSTLLTRIRASIEEQARSIEEEQVTEKGEICPDCGIDLPTTWHWDGCPNDRRPEKVRLYAARAEFTRLMSTPIEW